MGTQVISNSGHDDMIHDAVLDYYGRRLATCSSDKTIKIFEVEGDTQRLIDTLKGHDGAVWCVSWAHPKYGPILASSSYDGKVFLWREQSPNAYTRILDFALHTASVNLVAWAPHEAGCLLACASTDGSVSILDFKDSTTSPQGQSIQQGAQAQWDHVIFPAHAIGCNAVSWAPATAPGTLEKASVTPAAPPVPIRRLATGGSDCLVKVWEFNATTAAYEPLVTLSGHTDWVRDVAWSPTVLSKSYIASASQDKTVRVWTLRGGEAAGDESNWLCKVLEFDAACWRVSWSLSGNVLAVSGGDNKVTLWKERVRDGEWECVKTVEE